jgi:molybdopterin-guanine dinucleotide biosynthesis protein A
MCGEPMLGRIYKTMERSHLFDDVIVYSKYQELTLEGCTIVKDPTKGTLIDSLVDSITKFEEFLAVAGDLPLLDHEIVSDFVSKYDGTPMAAVDSEGTVEPLFAIYNRQIYESILEYSRRSKQISTFVQREFNLLQMNQSQSEKLFNVNTKSDFEMAIKLVNCSHS